MKPKDILKEIEKEFDELISAEAIFGNGEKMRMCLLKPNEASAIKSFFTQKLQEAFRLGVGSVGLEEELKSDEIPVDPMGAIECGYEIAKEKLKKLKKKLLNQ